ncbi:alpha/beta hydrolase [bacterium]|nr:MAG: alpha/beta hydrolase [bacterium]
MSDSTASSTSPDTIVLVHGLWMTPRSWENWIKYFSEKGYKVITPAYPGFEIEVEALRANPSVIESSTVPNVVKHLEEVVGALDKPPILIGHSFGGTLVQILLDHGFGAAGVVIDSAPTEGVLLNPVSQIKSLFPILSHPGERNHTAPFTADQFHYAFTNTMPADEAAFVYERYYIPAPANFVWGAVLSNITPGHQATYVDYHNDDRAPLLFIAGSEDNIMPPSVNKSNMHHYKSKAVIDYHEFPGRCHFICGQQGWEEVADYALDWALKNQKS